MVENEAKISVVYNFLNFLFAVRKQCHIRTAQAGICPWRGTYQVQIVCFSFEHKGVPSSIGKQGNKRV
jgi:hypothetical protein